MCNYMFYNKLKKINVLNLSLNKNLHILRRSFRFVSKKQNYSRFRSSGINSI